jgi:hypothetical protein
MGQLDSTCSAPPRSRAGRSGTNKLFQLCESKGLKTGHHFITAGPKVESHQTMRFPKLWMQQLYKPHLEGGGVQLPTRSGTS